MRTDPPPLDFTRVNTEVGTSFEDIGAEIRMNGRRGLVNIEVVNGDSTQALSDFSLMVKMHPDSSFVNLKTSTSWATVDGVLLHFVGAPHTLVAGVTAIARLDVGPAVSIKFQAKVAANTADGVIVRGNII